MKTTAQPQLGRQGFELDWRTLGVSLAGVIAVLALFGTLALNSAERAGTMWWVLDLDRELNVTTLFSTALLITNGYLLLLLARRAETGGRPLFVLGLFFAFMGVDESLKIHETLEKLSGVDWQVLYLPLGLIAFPAWLYVFFRYDRTFRLLWIGGAGAWFASQALEAIQWTADDTKAAGYESMMVAEEVLEMSGSALFLVALFRCLTIGGERRR